MIVDFMIRALDAAGYAIDFANDGSAGLDLARTGDYSLVIMDLVMPEPDGHTLLDPAAARRPEQAVLVLSCLADVTSKVRCLELGAHDYLTKPFSLDELVARVRVQLRGDGHPRSEIMRTADVVLDTGRLQADIGHGPVAAHPAGVPAAPGAHGECGPGRGQRAPAGHGVGHGFRPRFQRGGRLHPAAPVETRVRADQDGARCGIPARVLAPSRPDGGVAAPPASGWLRARRWLTGSPTCGPASDGMSGPAGSTSSRGSAPDLRPAGAGAPGWA